MPFPLHDPLSSGLLTVDDGTRLWWEASGNPDGVPAVWLHGGPGSGAGVAYRQRLDPARWLIVSLDQRACGRSRPLIADAGFDLSTLTTQRMIADLERLRAHLGIERWLVAGGSWGSTLALAYAQAHPERVSAIVLVAVTTTSRAEVEWITESVGRIFPREWDAFAEASLRRPGQRLVDAYLERLTDPSTDVRLRAARAWCAWEDSHVSLDPSHQPTLALMEPVEQLRFSLHVVHSWANSGFLGRQGILDNLATVAHLPAVLIHGRLDVSAPLVTAWEIHKRWPASRLVVVEGEGHGGARMTAAVEDAYAALLGEIR